MDEHLKDDELPAELAAALRRLDTKAEKAAARVDAARVAGTVLKRLREEPAVTVVRPRRWSVSLRAAAAVALLVAGGFIAQRATSGGSSTVLATPGPIDLLLADSAQRTALLAAVEQVQWSDSMTTTSSTVLVEDLDETELETLLTSMESAL